MQGVVGEQRMQRVKTNDIGPKLRRELNELLEIGKVPYAPIALRAEAVELDCEAPDPALLRYPKRLIADSRSHDQGQVRAGLSDYLEAVIAERWPAGKRKQVAGEVCPRYLPLFQYLEIQRAKIAAMLFVTLLHQAPAQGLMGTCNRNGEVDPKWALCFLLHHLDRR
jgi:hypothetical protein